MFRSSRRPSEREDSFKCVSDVSEFWELPEGSNVHFVTCSTIILVISGSFSFFFCTVSMTQPAPKEFLYLRVRGGVVGNTNSLAPKLGPKGIPPKKAAEDIAKATKDFKGLKCTVRLVIQNRQFTVELVKNAATLLIQALNEPPREKGSSKPHNGNLSLDQVKAIARQMRHKSLGRNLQACVLEVLGTAVSVGCTIDNESPKEISKKIKDKKITIPDEDFERTWSEDEN